MINNPTDARVGRFTNAFDISVGLDDGFKVPSYEAVVE
jgi:hypothetical protein